MGVSIISHKIGFRFFIFVLSIIGGLFSFNASAFASVTNGTLSGKVFVCHDSACSTPTPGVITFSVTGISPVTISDSGLVGTAWGNEIGWINFAPTGGGVEQEHGYSQEED